MPALRLEKGVQDSPAILRAVGPKLHGGSVGGSWPPGTLPREALLLTFPTLLLTNRLLPSGTRGQSQNPALSLSHPPWPRPASPSHGYSSQFKGTAFPAQGGQAMPSAPWHPASAEHVFAVATRPPDQTCTQIHRVIFFLKNVSHVLSPHVSFLS